MYNNIPSTHLIDHLSTCFSILLRSTPTVIALLVLAAWPVTSTRAQSTTTIPEANPADVKTIDGIIAALYDVISGAKGKELDSDRLRSLFHPEARLTRAGRSRDGSITAKLWSVDDYVIAAGNYVVQFGLFDNEIHSVREKYGSITHVFSTHESRNSADDEKRLMRGINSIQLMNDGTRWWVVNIFWLQETTSNPIPDRYLPSN